MQIWISCWRNVLSQGVIQSLIIFFFSLYLFGQTKSRLSENLQCKSPQFLTKWWDLLDLSKKEKLLDMVYMHPGGVHTAMDLFLF